MKSRVPFLFVTMGLCRLATVASDAAISYVPITGDADSGIDSANIYTHTLDFGTGVPGALVNGVQFDAYTSSANGTLNFLRTVSSGTENDNPGNAAHNVTGALANLLTDMIYNGGNEVGGTTVWTVSGLTAGVTYETRIYTRQWGSPNDRSATLTFDPDGAGAISEATSLINQDDATTIGMPASNSAYYINYRFTAVESQNLVITASQNNVNQSWHLYGLTNQVVPEPSTTVFAGLIGLGLLARRRRA